MLKDIVIKNAVIESAEITTADSGVLDCWLHLDFGGPGQAFGGYALYLPKWFRRHQLLSAAGHHLFRIMEIAGVEKWSQLKGRTIRVEGSFSEIKQIGHIVKDDWYCPSEDFKAVLTSSANAEGRHAINNPPPSTNPSGASAPVAWSASLVWNAGPARGGGGTSQREMPEGHGSYSWWADGDLLLVIVDTNSGPDVSLVRVSADGTQLGFHDPETGDDSWGWTDTDISWWARIMESLPQNARSAGSAESEKPTP